MVRVNFLYTYQVKTMEVISNTEIKVGYQYISIPEGQTILNVTPFEVKNLHSDEEDFLKFYSFLDKVICERIDKNWSYSVFAIGSTVEEAETNTLDAKNKAHPGIYFQNTGLSWMIRELMQIKAKLPTIPDLTKFKKFRITNSQDGYCAGFMDTKILISGVNSAYLFQYSGDENNPIGKILWGQKWLSESYQYLGSGKHVQADPTLVWQLNNTTLEDALNYNPATQRPTNKTKKVISI